MRAALLPLCLCALRSATSSAAVNTTVVRTTTTASSSRASTTPEPIGSTAKGIGNDAVFGCRWPDDYLSRFKFCAEQNGFGGLNYTKDDVKYGLLDRPMMDLLVGKCDNNNLHSCVRLLPEEGLSRFRQSWFGNVKKLENFEECLRQNTEGMTKLCGVDKEISRVVSGAAGLHLNLLNILIRSHHAAQQADANVTDNCLNKVAEAIHVTAALYVQSRHYMDNSVLCWNVIHRTCLSYCSAYAAELNCMQAECPGLNVALLQEFGIWQWYFLNTKLAREHCSIDSERCTVTESGTSSGQTAIASLFDVGEWQTKVQQLGRRLEKQLDIPLHVIIAIAVGTVMAFLASVTLLCMWTYGLVGKSKRNLRYTRLGERRKDEEGRSLTREIDAEDMD